MMWDLVIGATLMFSGQEQGRWDPCHCDGRRFPGVTHRSALLETLRKDYPDALYFATGDLMPGKSNLETLRAALDLLRLENPLFFAPGEKDMETPPEMWESAFTGKPVKRKEEHPSEETGDPSRWSPPPFPAVISNGHFGWAQKYYDTRIEGKRFIFLNFVDPLRVSLEWNLMPVDWAIRDLEDVLGLWQVYPEDIFTVVVLHMDPGDAVAVARAHAERWNLVIVAHERQFDSRFLDRRSLAIGASPCGDVTLFHWDVLDFPGKYEHRRVFLEGEPVVKPDEKILANLARLVAREKERGEPKPEASGLIVGSGSCENCHKAQTAHWKKTKHAVRFEGDVKVCGSCHSPLASVGERSVGCEACHTGGSRHIFSHTARKFGQPTDVVRMPRVDRNGCTPCHKPDGKHITKFDADASWKTILHSVAPESRDSAPPPPAETPKAEKP